MRSRVAEPRSVESPASGAPPSAHSLSRAARGPSPPAAATREPAAALSPSTADPIAVQASLGPGEPLEGSVRGRMEGVFGRSFSHVRVHRDHAASRAANVLDARAFTVGSNLAFNSGEYDPHSLRGEALIAHELVHAIQQEAAAPVVTQGALPENGRAERDADSATISAVAALWQAHKTGRAQDASYKPYEKIAGLQLQRCGKGETAFGKFDVSNYKVNDSDAGNDTAKICGAAIDISFAPNDKVTTNKIGFVQTMKCIQGDGTPLLFPNETPRATTAAQGEAGWAVDRLAGKKFGTYGTENSGAESGGAGVGNMTFGYRKVNGDTKAAWMHDSITLPRAAGQTFNCLAKTFALDVDRSQYLGGIKWGYDVDTKGKVKLVDWDVVSQNDPAGAQKSAIQDWNAQAANPDPAKRNAADQQALPVPP